MKWCRLELGFVSSEESMPKHLEFAWFIFDLTGKVRVSAPRNKGRGQCEMHVWLLCSPGMASLSAPTDQPCPPQGPLGTQSQWMWWIWAPQSDADFLPANLVKCTWALQGVINRGNNRLVVSKLFNFHSDSLTDTFTVPLVKMKSSVSLLGPLECSILILYYLYLD